LKQRVAKAPDSGLLVALKAFAGELSELELIQGVKLTLAIAHRSFAEHGPAQFDEVEVYAPAAEIRRFADADITSQGLLDKSVIIVNSNRTEVKLSDS
jgi:hypothetical protein